MANSSQALDSLKIGLTAVDNVLSFVKTGRGKPTHKEQSLFTASVALSYAVWEDFAENLAIEATEALAKDIDADNVPQAAEKFISHNSSAWDLSVSPGWRSIWYDRVVERAKGSTSDEEDFGLLTASVKKVRALFQHAGLDPFDGKNDDELKAIDELVALRGLIVHTGRAPDGFGKADALSSKDSVNDFASHANDVVFDQVANLIGKNPW